MPPRTRASLRQDAERFYDALQNLIRSYQFRSISGSCRHDLSVTECYCLEVIVREGPLALSTLARGIRLDKSTLSRTISNLESKRYVEREVLDCDARARGFGPRRPAGSFIGASAARLCAATRRSLRD